MEKHLADCPACTAELQEIRQLDLLLDSWSTEPAPDDLWNSVMAEVDKCCPPSEPVLKRAGGSHWHGQSTYGKRAELVPGNMAAATTVSSTYSGRPGLLLEDLAIAAVISLAISWSAGTWLDGDQILAIGESINSAVTACTQVVDTALEYVNGTVGEYIHKFFFEEWKQR